MPKLFIDGVMLEAGDHQNLLQAVLSLGLDLPYFCWHPALHSVGACRQCAVKQFKDESDTKGRIVMACMTPATDGARISINDPEARAFRAGVIEWLMTNHPHDCPVCDEGGECHLQDMTLMSGHNYRRFRFPKRTFTNQYLGPFINHEMNRCITCYRCVRFYNDYAGGKDLGAFALRNQVYFGRTEEGTLENEFSGNLIEVCPTGVFTDKTFKSHYTRKWDLQSSPSICQHCSLGCNIAPGERYGVLRRIRNRYHHEINGYFLCDRGRFGYEFVNDAQRIRHAVVRSEERTDDRRMIPHEEALEMLKMLVLTSTHIAAIGSSRASVETNFALKTVADPGSYSSGTGRTERLLVKRCAEALRSSAVRKASIRDIEDADAVVVLGEDLTNTAPRMALAVRQASRARVLAQASKLGIPHWNDAAVRALEQDHKGPICIATVSHTKLDEIATHVSTGTADEIARMAWGASSMLDTSVAIVSDLSEESRRTAEAIAALLLHAERPVIIAGTSQKSETVIDAASALARACGAAAKKAGLAFVLPECNSMSAAFIDGVPVEEVASASAQKDLLILCEIDLYRLMNPTEVEQFLTGFRHVVVLDHTQTRTTEKADLVLPVASFAEGSGTLINNEGRAQRFFSVFPAADDMAESWRWIAGGLSVRTPDRMRPWNTLDDILRSIASAVPELSAIVRSAPGAGFTVEGLKIPRQTPGSSGRTAVRAHQTIHEWKPPVDIDSPLAYSMEGFQGQPPPSLTPFVWAPGWNSVQALTKYQTVAGGPLIGGSPGVKLLTEQTARTQASTAIPPKFIRRPDEYLTVFLHHIFGSEELSARAPGIRERSEAPYLGVSAEDAARLDLQPGALLTIEPSSGTGLALRLPCAIVPGLVSGVIGVPVGLAGLEMLHLQSPEWMKLRKDA
ncbi:MAG TPA: NADH-quinone oxidoreductase subunit NuoG [Bacteroidota bacterium]|nr:NADH-quinone oxidoreductase subunit NuoG [Bacteroidota bacterium]